MKRLLMVMVLVITAAMILSACGGGGGGGGGVVVSAPTTTTQAQQAASSGTQGANMGTGSATTFQNFGQIGLSAAGAPPVKIRNVHQLDPGMGKAVKLSGKFAKSKAVAKAVAGLKKAKSMAQVSWSGSGACMDGGSYSYTGTIDDVTYTYDLTMTMNNCREYGTDTNGTITLKGTENASGGFSFTEQLGTSSSNKLTMLEFGDETYTMLVARMETLMTLTMSGSINLTTYAITLTFTANGTMDVLDYLSMNSYNMTFTNNSITYAYTSGTSTETDDYTMNGSFSESWTDGPTTYGVAMSFVNFEVTDVWNTTTWEMDETLSGTMSINFTPDTCFEGGYSFETVTPIHYTAYGLTTAGHIIVNTTTHIYFNANGTIDVTIVSGGTTTVVANDIDPYDLALLCEFQTLDEPAPTSTGTSGSTQGSSMTVTSLSSNPSGTLDCYTDLHVNYYNTTTPTALTTGTWYVDWHVSDGSTVPSGSNFQQYRDIDGDLVADVGLDINGSEYDSTSGGLEHFSAYKLPVGYYVISMNNYSCSTGVSNMVNVQIGNDVFGPVTCTYSASDIDGTTPGAWCRVADVVVTSSGVAVNLGADVNTSLEPWHDGAFGMYAPKAARKVQ